MPKINTYVFDTVISTSDFLVGSDAENTDKTKNFKISDLITFFSSEISASDLQGYSESGVRNLGTLITILGDYDDTGNGTAITIDDSTGIIELDLGTYVRIKGTTGISHLATDLLTTTRTHKFQDSDGTLAHLTDIFSGSYNDLTGKPTIPTLTSDLTNDGNGVSVFATISQVPTLTSDLTNDSGFITIASVPTLTSQLTNDSGFITSAPTLTSDLTNNGADNTSTYVEHDELATVATSGLYSDLSGLPTAPAQVNVVALVGSGAASDGQYILADASGGNMTITLPAAGANKRIHITKIDASAFTVTIDGATSETINGQLTQTLNTQYDSITLFADTKEWFIE